MDSLKNIVSTQNHTEELAEFVYQIAWKRDYNLLDAKDF